MLAATTGCAASAATGVRASFRTSSASRTRGTGSSRASDASISGRHAENSTAVRSGGRVGRGWSRRAAGVRCAAVRSSRSPSRRAEKPQLASNKDGRGKAVAANAISPPNADADSIGGSIDESILGDFASLEKMEVKDFEELSAKVAQLQAALAEVDNVGAIDRAELEEAYKIPSFEENDSADEREAVDDEAAAKPKPKPKKKAAAKPKAAASTAPRAKRKTVKRVNTKTQLTGIVAEPGSAQEANEASAAESRRNRRIARKNADTRKQTDSMKTYLKDIGTVSLLTGAEEVELAKRIQDLMYLNSVYERLEEEKGGKEPTRFEWAIDCNITEQELEHRLEEGKRAKNAMIQANLRLVVSIAKRYANKSMSFQDLIQEGCVGLIRGAEKFDFKRGYKFSTYAHWWIRQAVTRSISDQSRTIRLPVHLFEIISRMSKVERQMVLKLGRDPTHEELADAMEMTVEKIKQIKKASLVPISLSQTVNHNSNGEDKRTVEDTLIDDYTEHPEGETGKVLLKEDLENVLNTLNPRERDVLRLRYGLDDGRVKTLEEIGNVFSVTRERIRQIEAKALRKLRQPSRNGILREYLPNDHESVIDTA
uniref:RNA polymerase sigma-70 domain-containing protein n=1 Tax=Micromonas pusilla TaxID=38833 RepID=A0A7S0KY22_MICPS|mmetsp:Transcript_14259/g.58018  ORF Transcript_14259/g.58018 Transcript_14259/m.58018 type:complete len:597 (-) Transcript_14259:998-2788(-)